MIEPNRTKQSFILFIALGILSVLFWYENVTNIYSPIFILVSLFFLVCFGLYSVTNHLQAVKFFVILAIFQLLFVSLVTLCVFKDVVSVAILVITAGYCLMIGTYMYNNINNVILDITTDHIDMTVNGTKTYLAIWLVGLLIPLSYWAYRKYQPDIIIFMLLLTLVVISTITYNRYFSDFLNFLVVIYFVVKAIYLARTS